MTKTGLTAVVTMREFRRAPAKLLSRAARGKIRLRIGDFVLAVERAGERDDTSVVHGCMRETGRLVGGPADLLSAHDRWSTDA